MSEMRTRIPQRESRVTILGVPNLVALAPGQPSQEGGSCSIQHHIENTFRGAEEGQGSRGEERKWVHILGWGTAWQSCPFAWSASPFKQGCCQKNPSCPPTPSPGLWGLHGYEARHGGLETVKDVAGGEGHEVVHEGRQGEDKQEPFVLGFAVWRRERTVSGAQGGWDSLPLIQPSCRVSTQPGPTLGQPLPSQTAGLVGSSP